MRVALVDGDIIAFRASASCKGDDPPEIANIRADKLINQIIESTQVDDVKVFISGQRNFRYDLYPLYKANRKSTEPPHRQSCKEFLVVEWNGRVSDGYEADDAIAIEHTRLTKKGLAPVICSIDKDFQQLAGEFYNFVSEDSFFVTELQAKRTFYKQLVLGDKSDNIPGFDGKARQKPTKVIQYHHELIDGAETDVEMYNQCLDAFCESGGQTEDDLILTAKLCYLLRHEDDVWHPPK